MSIYRYGLDILGASDAVVRRIQMSNVIAYRAVGASDAQPGAAVDRDVETKDGAPISTADAVVLQVGDEVTVIGPAGMSAGTKAVSYTPVAVSGRDGKYWVRTAALGTVADYGKKIAAAPVSEPFPMWKVGLGIGAGAVALAVITALVLRGRGAPAPSASSGAHLERSRPTALLKAAR